MDFFKIYKYVFYIYIIYKYINAYVCGHLCMYLFKKMRKILFMMVIASGEVE